MPPTVTRVVPVGIGVVPLTAVDPSATIGYKGPAPLTFIKELIATRFVTVGSLYQMLENRRAIACDSSASMPVDSIGNRFRRPSGHFPFDIDELPDSLDLQNRGLASGQFMKGPAQLLHAPERRTVQ